MNPYCVVSVHGNEKKTSLKKKTMSPVWDRSFNFEMKNLSRSDLESIKIFVSVKDHSSLYFDDTIGVYEVDLTSVYFNRGHSFRKSWFTLYDPSEKIEGCMGFVKMDLEVLGPGDESSTFEGGVDDPGTSATIFSSKVKPKGHLIVAEIYRAEYLAPVGFASRRLDAFVKLSFGGVTRQTKIVTDTSNPEFNQVIHLQAYLPNHSKHVRLELLHDGLATDAVVGTAQLAFNSFKYSDSMKPTWLNLYGPPLYADLTGPAESAAGASTFRGRVLVRLSSRDEASPSSEVLNMEFRPPVFSIPNPLSKTYTWRVDLFEGNEVPTSEQGLVHFCLGPYMLKSRMERISNARIDWSEQLAERRITLPVDLSMIPDLVVYFADEDAESHRLSFARVKASQFIALNRETYDRCQIPCIFKLREEKSNRLPGKASFPGFLVARITLLAYTAPPRPPLRIPPAPLSAIAAGVGRGYARTKYKLAIFVYIARDLAAIEADGTSSPFVSFSSGGQVVRTKTHRATLNPDFYETVILDIELSEDPHAAPPALVVLLQHERRSNGIFKGDFSLIGRYWLLLNVRTKRQLVVGRDPKETVGIYAGRPRWVPIIYDRGGRVDGRLLMGYAAFPANQEGKVNLPQSLKPTVSAEPITLFGFGFRDLAGGSGASMPTGLNYALKINSSFSGEKTKKSAGETNEFGLYDLSSNQPTRIVVEVPLLPALCPILEVFLYKTGPLGERQFLGVGQFPLAKEFGYVYGEDQDPAYREKWNEFFTLDKIIDRANTRVGPLRAKFQKFRPENKLVYLENIVYELEDRKSIGSTAPNSGELTPESYSKSGRFRENRLAKDSEQVEHINAEFLLDKSEDEGDDAFEKHARLAKKPPMMQDQADDLLSNPSEDLPSPPASPRPIHQKPQRSAAATATPFSSKKQTGTEMIKGGGPGAWGEGKEKVVIQQEELQDDSEGSVEVSQFGLNSEHSFLELSAELSEKAVRFDDVHVPENRDARERAHDNQTRRFIEGLRFPNQLKGLFGGKGSNDKELQYQDFDSEEGEDYDDLLPYLKGRIEVPDDLEDALFASPNDRVVSTMFLYRGNSRPEGGFLRPKADGSGKVAKFKFLIVRENRPDLVPFKRIERFLRNVTRPKEFVARVYVLRGLNLASTLETPSPHTYLKYNFNGLQVEDAESSRTGAFPEFYRSQEFAISRLPGTAMLRVEVWEKVLLGRDVLLGYTDIDLEDRFFSIRWQKQPRKPLERRNLLNDYYGSRGRLEMWIDLISGNSREPRTVVYPKTQRPFELRAIVWETKDVRHKNELNGSNDLFAKGGLHLNPQLLETDTHWNCRGKGSFNWRWKFDLSLPVDEHKNPGEDHFVVQLWNRDSETRNQLIGETIIDLQTHSMLKKAYFRKAQVDMRLRVKGTAQETAKIWFDVFHPDKLDLWGNRISQGKVLLSFQAMPKELTEKFPNSLGRDEPNFHPTLPKPLGRLRFDPLRPLETLRDVIGPREFWKLIAFGSIGAVILLGILFVWNALAAYVGLQWSLNQCNTVPAVSPATSTASAALNMLLE